MHHEMNFANNFLKIMTDENDIMKVRRDLQHRGMKPHLWLIINLQRSRKMLKLVAPYVLTPSEFDTFATITENLWTPSRHVSVMGNYIRKKNFGGLKSHDYHVLMQQFLLLALHALLAIRPSMIMMRFPKKLSGFVTTFGILLKLIHFESILQLAFL
jgi:hypothetical protein